MTKQITSKDNLKLKNIRKLINRKERDYLGKFIIEGENLVDAALENKASVDYIIIDDKFKNQGIINKIILSGIEIFSISDDLFKSISNTCNGSGIIGVADKCFKKDDLNFSSGILILDRLQDPGNVGTIIRTALASGISSILALKGTVDIFSPKVLRATAGAIFKMPIIYFDEESDIIDLVKKYNKDIVVTIVNGGTQYYEANISRHSAIVLGNEGGGVSNEFIKHASKIVTIPMNHEIDSLNVAISAGILMYEMIREK